jgi:hypothetical protein
MFRRCVFGAMALWIATPAAFATPSDYCKAYAIDFADGTKRDTPFWDQRFADAEKACLLQYSYEGGFSKEKFEQVAKAKPKPKPIVEVQAKAVEAAAAEVDVAAAVVNAKPARKKAKPEEGSVAWLDYCEKKYASFNRKKGTYISRSGVERKCLVTSRSQ